MKPIEKNELWQMQVPYRYFPISPWAYFGYMILFSLPLMGFIICIVYARDNTNIVLRSFARFVLSGYIVVISLIVLSVLLPLLMLIF